MSQKHWQRRSSSMKPGGRSSFQDANKPGMSRIPMRCSSQPNGLNNIPGLIRSKSTLGISTPQQALGSSNKITPQNIIQTPKFFSSKKGGSFKDPRNIHDKDFLRDAHLTVFAYFKQHHPEVLVKQGTDIRPITIKAFIEMMNRLFGKLGIYKANDLVVFSLTGYQNEIPHWMKQFNYPGVITKGWLQTVNVPTCWPNVVALLSWLVNLINASSMYDLATQLDLNLENDQKKLEDVTIFKGCLKAHNLYHDGDSDAYKSVSMEVVDALEMLKGFNEDVILNLQETANQLRDQVDDPELQAEKDAMDELVQRLEVAKSQVKKNEDDKERINEKINNINDETAKRHRNIDALRSEVERKRKEIDALKGQVKGQSMSVTEFSEVKKKCDYLLKEIAYMQKEYEDNERLVQDCDHRIATKRDKVLQNASSFNRFVIQLEQQIPSLTGIRARVNPESTDVVEEVEKLVHTIKERQNRLKSEIEELEILRQEKQAAIDILKMKLREIAESDEENKKYVAKKKEEIEKLKKSVAQVEATLKAESDELDRQLRVCKQKQLENESLNEQLHDRQKMLDLKDQDKEVFDKWVKDTWESLSESAKFVEEEMGNIVKAIEEQDQLIAEETEKLIAELYVK